MVERAPKAKVALRSKRSRFKACSFDLAPTDDVNPGGTTIKVHGTKPITECKCQRFFVLFPPGSHRRAALRGAGNFVGLKPPNPRLASALKELDAFVDGVLNGGPLPGKLKATRAGFFPAFSFPEGGSRHMGTRVVNWSQVSRWVLVKGVVARLPPHMAGHSPVAFHSAAGCR